MRASQITQSSGRRVGRVVDPADDGARAEGGTRRRLDATDDAVAAGAAVTAPMQGTIVHVAVSDGQSIARGELVAVLEAMKMENRVLAHRDGIVGGIETEAGASLSAGAVICRIDDAPDPAP